MSRIDDPTPPPTPVEAKVVLPRPNLGPEPWAEPEPAFGPFGWVSGSILLILALTLTIRRWRWGLRRRSTIDPADSTTPNLEAESSPSRRLIASSRGVRAALIAEFGPGWGSRTTEEIANDPSLADRLGTELAGKVVAYLLRVDRAKFAGEEFEDSDEWIAQARSFLDRFPRPGRTARPPS